MLSVTLSVSLPHVPLGDPHIKHLPEFIIKKVPKCPTIGKYVSKLWHFHMTEYHTSIKMITLKTTEIGKMFMT